MERINSSASAESLGNGRVDSPARIASRDRWPSSYTVKYWSPH